MPVLQRLPVGLSWHSQSVRPAPVYGADEQRLIALLLLPIMIAAMSLAISQAGKVPARLRDVAARTAPPRPDIRSTPTIVPQPMAQPIPQQIAGPPLAMPGRAPIVVGIAPAPQPAGELSLLPPPVVVPLPMAAGLISPLLAMPTAAPTVIGIAPVPTPVGRLALLPPPTVQPLPTEAGVVVSTLAMPKAAPIVVGIVPIPMPAGRLAMLPPPQVAPLPPIQDTIAPTPSIANALCSPVPKRVARSAPPPPEEFGTRLAQAAHAQTSDFVIYHAGYRRIAYPMGDIPSLYGACSDVIIRAYRALGIDLQDLVQRARVGSGDPNIDHRRTETLRIFFARHGQEIAPSTHGEDYKPGDIVTYYRPYSRVSRAHIAIVSEQIGASGQPMIIHNRGWGPQLEDALFVDRITGHYRFVGAPHLSALNGRSSAPATARANAPTPIPASRALSMPLSQRRAAL